MTAPPGGPDDRSQRLAVYGTLVPGGANAHVLARLGGVWEPGTVRGTRHDDGWHGYPGLVLDDAGEVPVMLLTASALVGAWADIDSFEGPGYRRVTVEVTPADGSRVDAQVYVLVEPPRGS